MRFCPASLVRFARRWHGLDSPDLVATHRKPPALRSGARFPSGLATRSAFLFPQLFQKRIFPIEVNECARARSERRPSRTALGVAALSTRRNRDRCLQTYVPCSGSNPSPGRPRRRHAPARHCRLPQKRGASTCVRRPRRCARRLCPCSCQRSTPHCPCSPSPFGRPRSDGIPAGHHRQTGGFDRRTGKAPNLDLSARNSGIQARLARRDPLQSRIQKEKTLMTRSHS